MSQRKEKYLRSALTQYEGIARDVDYLKNKVAVMDRDLNMARDRQAELGRAVKQREDAEERGRRERTRRARERNRRRSRRRSRRRKWKARAPREPSSCCRCWSRKKLCSRSSTARTYP